MRSEAIKMDYIGEISVNHYLGRRAGGGYYVKEEVVDWKTEFQWLLKRCHLEDFALPLQVTCDGYFKNERSAPDLSNLSKVILDAIQDSYSTPVNDKDFRWHDGKRVIGEKEPYLLITISESTTPQTPPDAPQAKIRRGKDKVSTKLLTRRSKGVK